MSRPFPGVISADVQAQCSRDTVVHVSETLGVHGVVRARARVVETASRSQVVISADVGASGRRFLRRKMPKTAAVSVVPVGAAFRRLVIAKAVAVQSAQIVARVDGIRLRSAGIALPIDDVSGAVVAVIVAVAVLVLAADVEARVARQGRRAIGETAPVGRPMSGAVERDVVTRAIGVDAADKVAHVPAERRTGADEALAERLGAVIVTGARDVIVVAVRDGVAGRP